jgi:hypothetical protein
MRLSGDRLRPAFDGKFTSVVVRMAGEGTHTGKRGDAEGQATAMVLLLAHHLDNLHGNMRRAVKQGFDLLVRFLRCSFVSPEREYSALLTTTSML